MCRDFRISMGLRKGLKKHAVHIFKVCGYFVNKTVIFDNRHCRQRYVVRKGQPGHYPFETSYLSYSQ